MKEQLVTTTPNSPDERMLDNPDRTPEANERLQALDEVIREYQHK